MVAGITTTPVLEDFIRIAKTAPSGKLADEINKTFGSLDELKAQIKQAVWAVWISWAWLVVKADGSLSVVATPNRITP
jgi:Fe-Mn family superoxide dismutase